MDLLDELLGVLTADEDLARVTEREVGRVVDDGVDDHATPTIRSSTLTSRTWP
jgi:hypothetical protein